MSIKVPQYQSTVSVTDQPFAGSRNIQVPESAFQSHITQGLQEFGGMVNQWAEKKLELKANSESAAAGQELEIKLGELFREQRLNPDPHQADAVAQAKAQEIYQGILQSKTLSNNRSRGVFTSTYASKLAEGLTKFRETNDERILEYDRNLTDDIANNMIRGIVSETNQLNQIRNVGELFGTNSGGFYSHNQVNLPVQDGIYQKAFKAGTITLAELEEKERAAAIAVYKGAVMEKVLGSEDPTAIVVELEEYGTLGDPILDNIAGKLDPVSKAQVLTELLTKAEKLENARINQRKQEEALARVNADALYSMIWNTDDPLRAQALWDELKIIGYMDDTNTAKVQKLFKNRGWDVVDGDEEVGFRTTEEGSSFRILMELENAVFDYTITPEAVNDYSEFLTEADYERLMNDAMQQRSTIDKAAIDRLSTEFKYELYKDEEEELGSAPRQFFQETKAEYTDWAAENPRATTTERRQKVRELIDSKKQAFSDMLFSSAKSYLQGKSLATSNWGFEIDMTDPKRSIHDALQAGMLSSDYQRDWAIAVIGTIEYYERLGVEWK